MTPSFDLLAGLTILYGVLALVVGYLIGSMRTFASLNYHDETTWQAWRTMLPHYGVAKFIRQRRGAR